MNLEMQPGAHHADGIGGPPVASSAGPYALRTGKGDLSDERHHAMTHAGAPASPQGEHLLLQGVTDYAIYLLDASGTILSWNTGGERIKGYTGSEVIGRHFSCFYTPEEIQHGVPEQVLAIASQVGRYETEGWRVRKDGSQFWTSVMIQALHDDDGRLIGFAKITRDITEQRQAQLEVERARDALSHAQKMEAIGRLTGGVAHDFNNLLTIIRTSVELLRRPGLSEQRRAKYIDAIADTADRASLLTRQLLAFARRQPLTPQLFDPRARIEGMTQILKATLGATIELTLDFADDLGAIYADPTQFETALLNVVINARDAMPAGGKLAIRARNVTGLPPIRRHAAADGAFVAVSVQDTGSGIEPAVLERIFEPFFTTKEVDKGTGLGLSQVYGFAKQSGGEIDVHSELGVGTTFTLYMPHAQETPAQAPQGEDDTPAMAPGVQQRNVLLVEDNQVVGQFVNNLLIELGQSPTWVSNGQAALATLEENGGKFDLVFSDVVMPGMTGVELGREIRRRWPHVRVVLTSGYSHVLVEEGSHGFELLHKPYTVEDLVRLLNGAARRGGTVT